MACGLLFQRSPSCPRLYGRVASNTLPVVCKRWWSSSFCGDSAAEESARRRWTQVALRFPSWYEHAGVAVFTVGLLNGLLVIFGFGITWLSTLKRYELDCKAARMRSELERTDRQLEALFGPLRAITHATDVGYRSFVLEHRRNSTHKAATASSGSCHVSTAAAGDACDELAGHLEKTIANKPRSPEGNRYRQLVSCMLQPLNRRAMETVLSHTHLIDGDFPHFLYEFYSHVIEMDALLERWSHRDLAVMFPPTPYPSQVNVWANSEFQRLREKQKLLLTDLDGSARNSPWS